MAKISVFFAIVLILLVILGALSARSGTRHLKLFMHIAVTVGLLGFLGTAMSLVDAVRLPQGKLFPYPVAIEEKAAMAILMLIFVVLCVRSFITAGRARA